MTVKPEIREVVEAVARLLRHGRREVRQVDLQTALPLGKSAISRRIAGALDGGFLKNLEERKDARQGSFSEIRCRLILRSFQLLTD